MQKNYSMKRQNVTASNSTAHKIKGAAWLVRVCVLMIGLTFGAASCHAACPSGTVSLYTPTPAGSQLEALYGLLPVLWRAYFKETLQLTSSPGRGGSYAVSRLLDTKDSRCFLAVVILPSVYLIAETTDSMFGDGDLNIVAVLASAPNAIWVAEESPFHSLADLVIHARAVNEKKGEFFTLAGTGRYTDQHLATLEFDRAAGVKSLYLPVLGSAEAAQAVKDGQATACWAYGVMPESMPGMRALGVAGEQRNPALPGVPTFREVHVDMINVAHFALAAAPRLPEEVMLQIRNSLATLMTDQGLLGLMAARGFIPLALDPQDLGAFLEGQRNDVGLRLAEYDLIPKHLQR